MIVNFSIDFFSSEECKSQFERDTGENTVQSMSSEDMHEEETETETEKETGENTVQSMSSEDVHVDAGDEELRVAVVYLTVQCNVV